MTAKVEFQEIALSGGKVTFTVVTDPDGKRKYQLTWTHSRPVPAAMFAVWALPQGVAVDGINMGGIGVPWNAPPVPGCYPVVIGSDSTGKFGHQCHACNGYWRAGGAAIMCPYCAARGEPYMFLTDAQKTYVMRYCDRLRQALDDENDGDHVIDMDAVALAAGKDMEKPAFYYAEENQQKAFSCEACGAFNDIIGKFCYCSGCGTRNDLHELEADTLAKLRTRANSGGGYESSASDAVAAFDAFAARYAKQLLQRVPLRSARRAKLERMRFHNLQTTASEFKAAFEIDIFDGMKPDDIAFATRMFHRRHVYEHNAGIADAKYLEDSGDQSVRLGQAIHETQTSTHQLIGSVAKMAENLHEGFHDIFAPEAAPIARWDDRKKRMNVKTPQKSA